MPNPLPEEGFAGFQGVTEVGFKAASVGKGLDSAFNLGRPEQLLPAPRCVVIPRTFTAMGLGDCLGL